MVEWIAELGSNHKGIPALAYRMTKEAAQAGATIIKFQAGRNKNDPIRYVDDWLPAAFTWCEMWGVEFLASCWSWEGLNLCRRLGMKRRKIAHQQANCNSQFALETIADGVETFVSINSSDRDNVTFYNTNKHFSNITWLWVSNKYPTYLSPYPQEIDRLDGYSHHGYGIAMPLTAVARGAKVIECHLTLDPTEESIKDNHFACTPNEFTLMVKVGNEIAQLGI